MSLLYLVNSNINDMEKQNYMQVKKYYEELIDEIHREEIINFEKKDKIIHVFINMSSQSNAIIDFLKTRDNLLNCKIQIYLHKLKYIEKFLEPITLTRDIRDKIFNVIAKSKKDGYTIYEKLTEWILNNNIKNYLVKTFHLHFFAMAIITCF